MNALSVVLHGPHPSAGGGVLAFCNTLESGLQKPELEVSRLYIGSATGDQTTRSGAVAGIKALIGSFPDVFRAASKRRVVHFNTSFTQKALMRDAVFLKIAQARGCPTVVEFHGGLPSSYEDRGSQWALRTLVKADQLVVIREGSGAIDLSEHPEWAMLDWKGRPTNQETLRGSRFTGVWMCPARRPGYTDQWLVPVLAEFASRYGDSTTAVWGSPMRRPPLHYSSMTGSRISFPPALWG